jgi:hypothetical protein
MRTTYVSHGNTLLAPLVGLILCVPHYIQGTMLCAMSRRRLPLSPFKAPSTG